MNALRPVLLILSLGGLLSSCEREQQPPAKPLSVSSSVTDRKEEAAIDNKLPLAIKSDAPPARKEHAPLLDVSTHNILPSSGGGPRLPYEISRFGGGSGRRETQAELESHDMQMLLHWNEMAIDASGRDHQTNPDVFSIMTYREQIGPGRASRAMAIVHIAIFEAINAIKGGYESYLGVPPVAEETNVEAAIATAAHDTLAALYLTQEDVFLYQKVLDLQAIPDSPAKERGVALGHEIATAVIALRANDGSAHPEPVIGVDYNPSDAPGIWRKDPISQIPFAIGAHWGEVDPFVLSSADQFRAPAPPALSSLEYAEAFNEVVALGGDGIITPTVRTEEQTEIGIFWAYDGVPNLCAPPRIFNQLAVQLIKDRGVDMVEAARLLAILNVAMADAGIAIWESKYHYQTWRPVTAIREADPGTGPSLIGDGNPLTTGDVNFSPLGAPATNSNGPNFTPPFPAYPSGHAGFGGTIFQILRRFFGTDHIAFTFVSDELNGITKDNQGNSRPLRPRSFTTLSQAEEENGQSRIYLGIHWAFDKTGGIAQGRLIGDYLWNHLYKKIE